MATIPLWVCTLFAHLTLLSSAYCPDFPCGNGLFKIPFTNMTDLSCTFLRVSCLEPTPRIQFKYGGHWYEIVEVSPADVSVNDKEPKHRICEFKPGRHLLTTNNSLSSFNCSHGDVTDLMFITRCWDNDTYGTDVNITFRFPKQCSLIPPPADDNIWSSTEFPVDMDEINHCYWCPENEGQCHAKSGKCMKGNNKLALKLGLGLGLPLGAVICLVTGFCLHRWYIKRRIASNIPSRSISDPYMNSDPEAGSVYYGVPVFSYKDLEEATNNFDSKKELGDGGFGAVYHGVLKDGRDVAIKRLYEHNYRRVEQFMNEIEILTRLRHKNLVTLYGCTSRRCRELLLVYEYIPNGTVADHLHGDRAQTSPLTWPIRMSIAIETATALAYLHASEIVHRDVKTSNILLDRNFCVKVADFGLSKLFPNDVTHVTTAPQGTPGYVDPEYHQCYQLTSKSDVYSFGVVLVELISSMPAVDITRHRHEINLSNLAISKIQKRAYNELIDPRLGFDSDSEARRMTIAVAQLAFQCLQQDKEMRPTMDEVLEELKRIESGKNEVENGEAFDSVTMCTTRLPPSPDCDEVGLLKNVKAEPPSPNAVTEKWPSSGSTTPNISG